MGSGCSIPQDKHIVIIGCGYGGMDLANQLLKRNANFTVIDNKDFFHHNIASVRAISEPGFAKKTVIPYAPAFGSHFKKGKVTAINTANNKIELQDSEEVSYDILVIATGSMNPLKEWSGTKEEIVDKHSRFADEVVKSKNIVIVGAGPVGIEIAGEIVTDHKDKNITIISGAKELMSGAPEKLVKKTTELLESSKINLVLGEYISNIDELPSGVLGAYTVSTNGGKTFEADLVIKCTGMKINTTAYENSLADHMEENGALKVNEYFQVKGFENIFAFGDCCNLNELKLAYVAGLAAKLLAGNFYNLLTNRQMKPWNPNSVEVYMAMSFGRNRCIGCTKGGTMIPEFILVRLKSRNMMVDRFFQEMKQTPPK